MSAERLQKILARAGVGSRRACEEIIVAGRVSVDGRVVTELGSKADPLVQDIWLDGQRLRAARPEYWLLNKPKGVVCTNFDPAGRPRPMDLMQPYTQSRLFPVGRLDSDSRGLLLMTNDGLLANRLTHPRYEVPKTYVAIVAGDVTKDDMRRLRRGIWLAEGRTRPAQVRLVRHSRQRSMLEVTLREGRNRQARRMLARLSHNVRDLIRIRMGRLTLSGVGVGRARRLMPEEVEYLKKLPDTPPEPPPQRPSRRGEAPRDAPRRGPKIEGARPFGAPALIREPSSRDRKVAGTQPGGERAAVREDARGFTPAARRGTAPRADARGPMPAARRGRKPYREKRSRFQHDSDGVGQAGRGDRGRPDRGRGRGPRRPDRPPPRGRRPYRHPPGQ